MGGPHHLKPLQEEMRFLQQTLPKGNPGWNTTLSDLPVDPFLWVLMGAGQSEGPPVPEDRSGTTRNQLSPMAWGGPPEGCVLSS